MQCSRSADICSSSVSRRVNANFEANIHEKQHFIIVTSFSQLPHVHKIETHLYSTQENQGSITNNYKSSNDTYFSKLEPTPIIRKHAHTKTKHVLNIKPLENTSKFDGAMQALINEFSILEFQ